MFTKPCLFCTQPIPRVSPQGKRIYDREYAERMFCSVSCKDAAAAESLRAIVPPRPCEVCGKDIPQVSRSGRHLAPAQYNKRSYCSRECARKGGKVLQRRNDNWEKCVNGHVHTDETRIIHANGLVSCRLCQREHRMARYWRKKQEARAMEREHGWIRIPNAVAEYGLDKTRLAVMARTGRIKAQRAQGGWLLWEDDLAPYCIQGDEMTSRDVRALLGISRQRLSQLVANGKLQARRVGRQWLFDRASVQARLAQQRGAA
jgi:excisionase family DNA binding protein